ncbi:MAG: hypothetical protein JWR55_690 [Aeromicrobium sp.]|jgi:hypothetical protein|nr:hypothetical protein [Aeromicrobium sp.]
MTSSIARVATLAVALAALTACSGSDESPEATATPSASATPDPIEDSAACSFLTPAERQQLAGVAVDTVVSAAAVREGSGQCRWQESAALIQVTTLPAKEWAKSLPDVVTQLESSTDLTSEADKKDLARAKKLLSGAATFTDAEACEAFVTLAELGGEKKGTKTTVTSVPITETESGISAQTCTDGALTSIIYSVPELTLTNEIEKTATTILDAAQVRVAAASQG